jgi:hypothetical protein
MSNRDYSTQVDASDILARMLGLQLRAAYVEGSKGLHLVFEGGHTLFIVGEEVSISAGLLEDSGPLH